MSSTLELAVAVVAVLVVVVEVVVVVPVPATVLVAVCVADTTSLTFTVNAASCATPAVERQATRKVVAFFRMPVVPPQLGRDVVWPAPYTPPEILQLLIPDVASLSLVAVPASTVVEAAESATGFAVVGVGTGSGVTADVVVFVVVSVVVVVLGVVAVVEPDETTAGGTLGPSTVAGTATLTVTEAVDAVPEALVQRSKKVTGLERMPVVPVQVGRLTC